MADPVLIAVAADVWTKVAENVTSGRVWPMDTRPSGYHHTYRMTGSVSAVADGGNTGDGTLTALKDIVGYAVAAGDWLLECTAAVANGGVWQLKNPAGEVVATGLTMTPGAGGATVLTSNGLTFTLTDGATDFAEADFFTITVDTPSGMAEAVGFEGLSQPISASAGIDVYVYADRAAGSVRVDV